MSYHRRHAGHVRVEADVVNASMLQYLAAEARGDERVWQYRGRYEALAAVYEAQCANLGAPGIAAA